MKNTLYQIGFFAWAGLYISPLCRRHFVYRSLLSLNFDSTEFTVRCFVEKFFSDELNVGDKEIRKANTIYWGKRFMIPIRNSLWVYQILLDTNKVEWIIKINFFFRWYNIVEKLIIDLKIKGEKIRVFSIFGEKWVKLNFNKKKKKQNIFFNGTWNISLVTFFPLYRCFFFLFF